MFAQDSGRDGLLTSGSVGLRVIGLLVPRSRCVARLDVLLVFWNAQSRKQL